MCYHILSFISYFKLLYHFFGCDTKKNMIEIENLERDICIMLNFERWYKNGCKEWSKDFLKLTVTISRF